MISSPPHAQQLCLTITYISKLIMLKEVIAVYTQVTARSKAWVCGRSLAGIAGSNPAGSMDVRLL